MRTKGARIGFLVGVLSALLVAATLTDGFECLLAIPIPASLFLLSFRGELAPLTPKLIAELTIVIGMNVFLWGLFGAWLERKLNQRSVPEFHA